MAKKTKTVKELVAEANEVVETLALDEARARLDDENTVFVDIRDVREVKRDGKLPGAEHAPRGMLEFWFDPESPYHKEVFAQDKTYVLYCASGWRSALGARALHEMGFDSICHIEGGFGSWKEAGHPVEDGPASST